VVTIIQQHDNIVFIKATMFHYVSLHVQTIVVAPLELTRLVVGIIDTNQYGTLGTMPSGRSKIKGLCHIHGLGGCELRNLLVSTLVENISHLAQHFHERQWLLILQLLFLPIQDCEKQRIRMFEGMESYTGEECDSEVSEKS